MLQTRKAGGSSIELAEAEYMVRASGYLQTLDDFNHIVLKASENGVPVYLRDVAKVQVGPEMRRGIAELNGEGEVAGGVVILRSGKKRPRSDRRREGQTGNAEK
ncbi:inner membrane component for iron transport [Shigella boydii]|nr:inner membrane component for iron transport [Shigella boydii]